MIVEYSGTSSFQLKLLSRPKCSPHCGGICSHDEFSNIVFHMANLVSLFFGELQLLFSAFKEPKSRILVPISTQMRWGQLTNKNKSTNSILTYNTYLISFHCFENLSANENVLFDWHIFWLGMKIADSNVLTLGIASAHSIRILF